MTKHFLAVLLILWATVSVPLVLGDVPSSSGDDQSATASLEEIKAQIETIKSAENMAEETRAAILPIYESAAKEVQRRIDRLRQAESFRQTLQRVPTDMEEIERRLKEIPDQPPTPAVPNDINEARALLATLESHLDQANKTVEEINNRFERRPKQLAELPAAIESLREKQEAIANELAVPPPAGDDPAIVDARRLLLEVRRAGLLADIEASQAERTLLQGMGNLLTRRRELESRQSSLLESQIQVVRAKVESFEEAKQRDLAQKALLAAANDDPRIQSVIAQNRSIASNYNNLPSHKKRQEHVGKRNEEVNAILDKVHEEAERTKRRLELATSNKVVSSMMQASRTSLPDPRLWRRRMLWAGDAAAETTLVKVEIDEALEPLLDIDQRIKDILGTVDGNKSAERIAQEKILRGHLETQRDLYQSASDEYEKLLNNLYEYETQSRKLIDEVIQYDNFIAERILWVQSTTALSRADIMTLPAASIELIDPTRWLHAWDVIWKDLPKSPMLYASLVAGWLAAIFLRPRIRRRMKQIGSAVSKDYVHTPGLTAWALLYTLLLAGLWPVILFVLGHHLLSITAKIEVLAIGSALQSTAGVLFLVEFLRHLCRPHGLTVSHFRWKESSIVVLRRNLHWLTMVVVPLAFITTLLRSDVETPARLVLGRTLFMVEMLALATFLYRVLHHSKGVAENLMGTTRGSWVERLRLVWFPSVVLLPVGLAILAALGFFASATLLHHRLIQTLGLAVGVITTNALLIRWLFAVRGRLALEQARQRREAVALAHDENKESKDSPDMVNLSAVNLQTRRLLSLIVGLAFVVGMFGIWSDIVPAFRALERFAFWSRTEYVWETQIDPATGTRHLVREQKTAPVTLATFVLVGAISFAVVAASRNLPGLLEVAILSRLPLDAGARFAITSVARYAIMIIGLLLVSNMLGIHWDSVQWMAAAFSVGLGFGLQEIVANFVSGLILLAERPIRIGDVVTAGDLTGTVTRIQMRATTIRDWNRKELIIPNKEFITGKVINWTLSDRVLRLSIQIGLNYGADVAHVMRLLQDIARRHTKVLTDPGPSVLFDEMQDGTIKLSLFAFVGDLDDLGRTRNEIFAEIHGELNRQSIAVPTPEKDVNIHFGSAIPDIQQIIEKAA
jgi:potassium-dependent mechanosensitive channel